MPNSLFLSCVYEDKKHRDDVIRWVQAGKLGSEYATVIEGEDVRQHGENAIKNHLRPKIQGCGAVVALIGDDTHNRRWVGYELDVATSLNKKIVLARIPGTTGAPPAKFRNLPIVALNPEALAKALSSSA